MDDLLCKFAHHVRKLFALGSGYPLQSDSLWGNTNKAEELLHHGHPFCGEVIAFPVMAFADVAAGNKNAVRTLLKGLEDEMRGYPPAAHHANRKDIGSIL